MEMMSSFDVFGFPERHRRSWSYKNQQWVRIDETNPAVCFFLPNENIFFGVTLGCASRLKFAKIKKMGRVVPIRHDPDPKWRATVCGRAGPGGRFLADRMQVEPSLSPRGVYFIIRRSERLERTRRREGFNAAPPHGQDYFWGEN